MLFSADACFRSRPGDARVAQHCALLPDEGETSVVPQGITCCFRQLFSFEEEACACCLSQIRMLVLVIQAVNKTPKRRPRVARCDDD